ncbi:ATP-binding protein, partial [Herbiconiux sp.]|uniref:ATP-binding protein n=1 Tax=Herbiconiux sp. TaxID=1871186 RepID=UPI00344E607C
MTEPATGSGAVAGPGERSARRILMLYSALLIVIVLVVHLGFASQGGLDGYPPWSILLGWLAAVSTVVAGAVAHRVRDATLRVLAIVAVIGYLATVVTYPAAVPAEGVERIPWTLSASGAAAAAALVAGGRGLAWGVVSVGLAAGLGYRTLYGGLDLDGVVNDLQALLTGAVICVLGGHVLAVGRGLDEAAASTTAATAAEAAERGRLAARTRAAAIVHDEVLATLSLAASELPVPRDRLAEQARAASTLVTRLAEEQGGGSVSLRTALADEARAHGASFTVRRETGPGERTAGHPAANGLGRPAVLPGTGGAASPAVVEALLGATRQALRNSSRHAPGAARGVVLVRSDDGIRVDVVDDGPGFDPAEIADDRLGIRQSIVARMERLDGGSAEIDSAPGRGTTVRLQASTPSAEPLVPADGRDALRTALRVIAVVFLVTQVASAVLAAVAVPGSWPLQLAVLASVLLAAEILRRSPDLLPLRGRTTLVAALAGGSFLSAVAAAFIAPRMPFSYGTLWFAVAFAFLLVALALRRRIAVALAGTAVIVGVLVGAGTLVGAPAGQIVQVSARPVVVVALALTLLLVVERQQRRIAVLHRGAVASAERESWSLAARTELTVRVGDVARTAVPLLDRIGAGEEATDAHRHEYARCEGELRDGLRAGALAREPLT